MILQALTRYYDILSSDPESDIAPPGYSSVAVSFALEISSEGKLLNVLPLFQGVVIGKKTVEQPQRMIVPEYAEPTVNIAASLLCGKSDYVLGISEKDDRKPEHSAKRFAEFRRFNKQLLVQANCDSARAVIAFLDKHNPANAYTHKAISPHLEEILKGRRIVFWFNGEYVHKDEAILQIWDKYRMEKDAVIGQCLVTGEISSIAIKHRRIQGIKNSQMAGNPLVSFNERAYESYNRIKAQGLNSPISEKAEFAYTTALNYLLLPSNENRKFHIGDTTVVYWAESENKEYARAFLGLCEPEEIEISAEEVKPARDKKVEQRLKKVAEKVRRVQALDVKKLLEGLDENPRFYVLGLAPNAARVSVRFFHSDPFDSVVEKIMKHYKDLEIVKEFDDQPTYLTIKHIVKETVSKKASDPEASPLMAGSVFRAVLQNAPYPAALYNAIINRVRADQDDSKQHIRKITYARAAIIKAYLLRKYRNQPQHPIQEVLVMSLNEQSTHPPYVLGRLFAWLEKVQQDAIGDMNASIKDRYFTSACASPASIFPILLRLSQHHISKAKQENKRTFNYDRRIGDILNLLDIENNPIPNRLSLDDQGAFILGYYHQRRDIFTPKNDSNVVQATESKNS